MTDAIEHVRAMLDSDWSISPKDRKSVVNEHINLTIDVRTMRSRERLSALRDEIRRILHKNRKGDGVNADRVIFKTRTDLSDRSKRLFRYTIQAEVVKFAQPLPIVS